jgi:hypothetical protein
MPDDPLASDAAEWTRAVEVRNQLGSHLKQIEHH